jgi:hypothetical protein
MKMGQMNSFSSQLKNFKILWKLMSYGTMNMPLILFTTTFEVALPEQQEIFGIK